MLVRRKMAPGESREVEAFSVSSGQRVLSGLSGPGTSIACRPQETTAMNDPFDSRSASDVSVTRLARRLGIPFRAAITAQLLACYGQSRHSLAAGPRWLCDLLRTARRVLADAPRRRRESAALAEARYLDCFTCFPRRAKPEYIRCCLALDRDKNGNLLVSLRLSPPIAGPTQKRRKQKNTL